MEEKKTAFTYLFVNLIFLLLRLPVKLLNYLLYICYICFIRFN